MRPRRARGRVARSEAGFTIVELLVASAMGVVLLGVAGSLVIGAMRSQPNLSKRAQSISSARWVLERLTREIREGLVVDRATASEVSLRTFVRRTYCGGPVSASDEPAIPCEVTYACTTTSCSRIESQPGIYEGAATTIFSGLSSSQVFCYVPSTNADSTSCGPVSEDANDTTQIGVTLRIPNPSGSGNLTISDGASLRNATLSN